MELKPPPAARPLERTRDVELSDRVSEQVDAERRSSRRPALPAAAEQRRALAAVPRDAAVGEEDDLERNRSVHPRRRGDERTKQREAEFQVADEHAAAEQPIERGALARRAGHACAGPEPDDIVAAPEGRVNVLTPVQCRILLAYALHTITCDSPC